MAKKITEENFDPKIHVKEYKRKCKVWHSLESREKAIDSNIKNNNFQIFANCCHPSAQLQAKRNVEANQSEIAKMKQCPNCSSRNYTEEIIIYEKK